MRKWIVRAQLVARREKEEWSAGAVRDAELAQRLHHRLHPVMVGRDREHPERLPAEMLLVLFASRSCTRGRGLSRRVGARRVLALATQ